MELSAASDSELLAAWVEQHREPAFHALVARYATLVHMAAMRTCGGDDSLAADASQLVFIPLAQKAKSLIKHPTLAGWLHVTAVNKTRDLIDKASRESRKRRHLSAAMEAHPTHSANDVWKEMQPVLDDALASLSAKDREALLLRFYRSLSVREIAATLGIATDAAQKRVDRATERLRGKLARRGCQTGGSLGATMVAGFAADAQAVVPAVSLLASKAIAASAVGAGFLPATAAILTIAMKSTSLIPPLVALILAGAWIGTRRHSISALDRQSDLLAAAISSRATTAAVDPAPAKLRPVAKRSKGKGPIDWNDVATQLAKAEFNDIDRMMLNQRLGAMSKEDLLGALDEINLLPISTKIRESMEEMVVYPLSGKFPDFTVTKLTEGNREISLSSENHLARAMEAWASKDYENASAWLDLQISSGTLDAKTLDGTNRVRTGFESALIRVLLAKGGDASRRLNEVPPERRKEVLMRVAWAWIDVSKEEEAGYMKMVREQLTATEQTEAIIERSNMMWGDLSAISGFLERIEATPEQRLGSVETVAVGKIAGIAVNRTVSRDDIVALRVWMEKEIPEAVNRYTGESLGHAVAHPGIAATNYRKMSYAEAAKFAVEFNQVAGNDEVLAAFLTSEGALTDKVQSRILAGRISDESRRAQILKSLE